MSKGGARLVIGIVVAVGLWFAMPATAEEPGAGRRGSAANKDDNGGGDVEVLNDQTIWRFHTMFCPPVSGRDPEIPPKPKTRDPWIGTGDGVSSPLPGKDSMKADFDDSGWVRRRGPFFSGYASRKSLGAALICVRGRFGVTDPAGVKDLNLTLTYRGGAVVYVNGNEMARGHMPRGAIKPLTPAQDYPREVFVTPDGRALLPDYGRRDPPEDLADRYQARIRTLTARVPNRLLRKGTNVLAVELHRTATPDDLPGRHGVNWDTVGLIAAKLTARAGSAVMANVKAPDGVQVWNADPLLQVGVEADYGDPFEPPRPVRLMAPRNGICSGQVVVSGPAEMRGLAAEVSDLRPSAGAAIPSSAIRLRYARPFGDRGFVALARRPAPKASLPTRTDGAKIQPIWLTVKVPAGAVPGTYTGELTIRGIGRPATVPLALTVYGWKVGDPGDWKTWVNLLESPESVAGYYGVPMWSDKHFDLMEKSLELMGEAGNDALGISAVAKNVFGDDPVFLFRKEGGRYVPEFKFVERYLELYDKHAGEPQFLCLHVWSYGMYQRGAGRDGGKVEKRAKTIPVVELRGEEQVPVEMPIYGEPGTEEVWRQVMDGLRERVERLGWRKECILLGTGGDCWPSEVTVAFFKKIAPYARWRVLTHGNGAPNYSGQKTERTQPNGMVLGYLEIARRITNNRSKLEDLPVACNTRDRVGTCPFDYRGLPGLNTIRAKFDGFSWKGLDYWTYTRPDGTRWNALNTYVHFGNMVGSTPRAIAAPGPQGAVATSQFEMLREGIQDCEAMLLIREALDDEAIRKRLGDDLAGRAEAAVEDLLDMVETGCRVRGGGDYRGQVARLYATATEVAEAIGRRH